MAFNRYLNQLAMIILLSPSKTMSFDAVSQFVKLTTPLFLKESHMLMRDLQLFSAANIMQRERLSARLAYSTYESYQRFFATDQPTKAALFAFSGTVFSKLNSTSFTAEQSAFAESHLRLFSALYGLLRPFDAICPYRLDMNSGLIPNLYSFWRDRITSFLMDSAKADDDVLINLASAEYFHLVDERQVASSCQVITPVFKQEKHGKLVVNTLYAKEARGFMARYIIENQLTMPEHLKAFWNQGYAFVSDLSTDKEWFFVR